MPQFSWHALKFGVFTGGPSFPEKLDFVAFITPTQRAFCFRQFAAIRGGHAKAKFSTNRGVLLLKFVSQKITLQASERIKKRILVHLLEFQALKSPVHLMEFQALTSLKR